MDNSKQIEQYLGELAQTLVKLQVTTPFHILIAGGAYMLLHNKRQSTLDIDFALIEIPYTASKTVFRATVQETEIANKKSPVPFAAEFKQAVKVVAKKHRNLLDDWMNDESAVYYYGDAPYPDVIPWKSFENIIYVYLPTAEYMLATKIAAYRLKDADDIQVLIQELGLQTKEQGQAVMDKFLSPKVQEFWEIEDKLDVLFP